MVANDIVYFYANYDVLGDIQTTKVSDEIVVCKGTVTKVKNGLIFFILDNETGERKVSEDKLNSFRDFGTSVYAVCDTLLTQGQIISSMIDVLNNRIAQTKNTMSKLNNQYEGL
jgi:hypothetical protein